MDLAALRAVLFTKVKRIDSQSIRTRLRRRRSIRKRIGWPLIWPPQSGILGTTICKTIRGRTASNKQNRTRRGKAYV